MSSSAGVGPLLHRRPRCARTVPFRGAETPVHPAGGRDSPLRLDLMILASTKSGRRPWPFSRLFHSLLDMARWLGTSAVVVARAGLGTINHTVLTVDALRSADVKVAGVVVNRYPADGATIAQETNPRQIERWARTHILAVIPEASVGDTLPPDIVAAVAPVDWEALAGAADR